MSHYKIPTLIKNCLNNRFFSLLSLSTIIIFCLNIVFKSHESQIYNEQLVHNTNKGVKKIEQKIISWNNLLKDNVQKIANQDKTKDILKHIAYYESDFSFIGFYREKGERITTTDQLFIPNNLPNSLKGENTYATKDQLEKFVKSSLQNLPTEKTNSELIAFSDRLGFPALVTIYPFIDHNGNQNYLTAVICNDRINTIIPHFKSSTTLMIGEKKEQFISIFNSDLPNLDQINQGIFSKIRKTPITKGRFQIKDQKSRITYNGYFRKIKNMPWTLVEINQHKPSGIGLLKMMALWMICFLILYIVSNLKNEQPIERKQDNANAEATKIIADTEEKKPQDIGGLDIPPTEKNLSPYIINNEEDQTVQKQTDDKTIKNPSSNLWQQAAHFNSCKNIVQIPIANTKISSSGNSIDSIFNEGTKIN
ncbi:MAG: hypothetical protein CMP10_09980 [Zetaproteobacteria bacterium]|nr:hypothetical protein [Pseudobdellovibrionaceae bacterium]